MAWVVACGCGDVAAPEIEESTGSSDGESSSSAAMGSSSDGESSSGGVVPGTTTEGEASSSTGEPEPLLPTDDADNLPGYADADDWNFPSDNYFVCGRLKSSSAQLRYMDFSFIGGEGEYSVTDALDSDECGSGEVRFDLHEILETSDGRLLFHKGGQGYDDTKTPYGHLWIADLESPSPKPQVSGEPPEYGTPSKIPGTSSWDWEKRNGVGCEASGDFDYVVRIVEQGAADELPADWQYKPDVTSSRYNKYADAGAEQAEETAHHAYLLWSWLHMGDGVTTSPGGGQVRVLLQDGQVFERCAVESIDSIAYAKGSSEEAGRVTAVYGRTRASDGSPWVYGWTIHSHRALLSDGSYSPRVYHFFVGS